MATMARLHTMNLLIGAVCFVVCLILERESDLDESRRVIVKIQYSPEDMSQISPSAPASHLFNFLCVGEFP
jgi:hypothetical protein